MGYKEKIQLLENNIKDLDKELAEVSSALIAIQKAEALLFEDTLSYTENVHKKTDDLSAKVNEMIKSNNAEKKEDIVNEFNSIKQDLIFVKNKAKSSFRVSRETNSQYVDQLRIQSKIIRQISIPTSDYVDKELIALEKIFRKLDKEIESFLDDEIQLEQLLKTFEETKKMRNEISHTIKISRDCIKATFDKLKD